MTVKELKDKLDEYGDHLEVYLADQEWRELPIYSPLVSVDTMLIDNKDVVVICQD